MTGIALKPTFRLIIQHYMNSLHFYCFLCRLNIRKEKAMKIAKVYEGFVHSLLYSQRGKRNERFKEKHKKQDSKTDSDNRQQANLGSPLRMAQWFGPHGD